MGKHLLVINGHPDPSPDRFCAALSAAFADGARSGGWSVHRLDAATLNFRSGVLQSVISPETAAGLIHATDRLAIVFPLWFDAPPAPVLQVLRTAARMPSCRALPPDVRRLQRREARLIITMEMPAFIHRSMLRADGRRKDGKELESLPGFDTAPVTFIGSVNTITQMQREQWLRDIRDLGASDSSAVKTSRRPWLPDMRALGVRAA